VNGLKPKYSGKVKFETISLDDPNNFKKYQKQYNLQGSPTVVVIDSSGTVVLNQAGIGDEGEYKDMVQSALEKASK